MFCVELKLMFNLMIRVKDGFLPMLADLEKYIREQGINDMKTHAETITVVSFTEYSRLNVKPSNT